MRWTVRREQAGAQRRWAIGAALSLAAAISVLAAGLSPNGARLVAARDYAVRIVLPAPQHAAPARAAPAAQAQPALPAAEPSAPAVREAPPASRAIATAAATHPPIRGVIALDYNLAGGAHAGGAIELDKPVVVRGAEAGRIALRIDGNARVFAQGRRVAALLAASGGPVPEGIGDDFVSLEALRALGVEVRYDAARDRLILDGPKA